MPYNKYKLFVNNDTGSVNDTNALSPMAIDAKELLGVETINTLTDKGIPLLSIWTNV